MTSAGVTHSRCIDNGQHLFNMCLHELVEQRFVPVLDIPQIDMLVQWFLKGTVLLVGPFDLFINGFIDRR